MIEEIIGVIISIVLTIASIAIYLGFIAIIVYVVIRAAMYALGIPA